MKKHGNTLKVKVSQTVLERNDTSVSYQDFLSASHIS